MPLYDRACPECDWTKADCYEIINAPPVLCPNGHTTDRVWRTGTRRVGVIADGIPGGMVIENMGHEPIRFDSWTDYRAEMKKRGLVNVVKHGDGPSKHTTRWV